MSDLQAFYDRSYRRFIQNIGEVPVNSSLVQFLTQHVSSYFKDPKNLKIFEAGVGCKSVFEKCQSINGLVMAVDFSKEAIEYARKNHDNENVEYICDDILSIDIKQEFDLFLDAHLLHCLVKNEDRYNYLEKVFSWIGKDGIFAFECMLSHKSMTFDDHFLYLEDSSTLLQQVGDQALPVRFIPSAIQLENLLRSVGFTIEYFVAYPHLKVIPDYSRSYPKNTDPDLVRVICSRR